MKYIDKIGYILVGLTLIVSITITIVGSKEATERQENFQQQFIENLNNL